MKARYGIYLFLFNKWSIDYFSAFRCDDKSFLGEARNYEGKVDGDLE